MTPENLLTVNDVAALLKVERHKASDLMKLMPCLVLPGTRTKRIRAIDLESWIIENRVVQGNMPVKPRTRKTAEPPIDLNLFEADGRIKRRR